MDRPPPNGFESVGVFIDGQKQTFAVPASVAESIKGLNVRQVDLITKIARLSASALRAGAVTLNIGFIPANAIRDFQSATLKSEVGFTPLDWLKGFSEAIREGNGFSSYLESGASMSGFIERTKPTRVKAKQLFRSRGGDVARTILNPVALLRAIGETVEQAPRRGVFNRAIRKGKTETEAAFFARNATVDFARSGSFLRYVNMWTPFLTARVGGNVNIATALQQRPMRSAAIMGAMIGLPTVATYLHNTRVFPEVYEDIPDFEKQNNYMLIMGDAKDARGRFTQLYKIPKGDVGRFFGNPIENYLAFLDGFNAQAVDDLAVDLLSDISPLPFAREGDVDFLRIATAVPPAIRGIAEGAFNVNFFTGRPIVPRRLQTVSPRKQFRPDTPKWAVELGNLLNMSPLKLINFVGVQFAGVGR